MLAGLFWGVVMCGLMFSQAAAQDDCNDPNVICRDRKPKPTPSPTRTNTNRRRQPPPPRRPVKPVEPLEFEWWVMKSDNESRKRPVNITELNSARDRYVLSVRVVEDGHLYVIHQPSEGSKGTLLYPSKYYNRGEDRVQKGDEFILPDCSNPVLSLPQPTVVGETMMVILSRRPIKELQTRPTPTGRVATIEASVITALRNTPGQQPSYLGALDKDKHIFYMEAISPQTDLIVETLSISNTGVTRAAAVNAAGN